MANCVQCGAELQEGALFCSTCGANQQAGYEVQPQQPGYQQPGYQQPTYQQPGYGQPYGTAPAPVNDSGSFGWAVLGFLIPIVGLVLFIVWRNEKPRCAKMSGMGALVSVILSVVLSLLGACASMVLLTSV